MVFEGPSRAQIEEHGRFKAAALCWLERGFNVVPGRAPGDKRPAVGYKPFYLPDSERVTEDLLDEWQLLYGSDVPCLVLLSSGRDYCYAVVDVDDPERQGWVLETFGEPEFTVATGREGGGVHNYYRVPVESIAQVTTSANLIGPEDAEPYKTRVDVKGFKQYTVAPGSLHKSGAEYQVTQFSEDGAPGQAERPVFFDLERHEKERESGFLRRGTRRQRRLPRHDEEATPVSDFEDVGTMSRHQEVLNELGGRQLLGKLRNGARFHAPHREDDNPSCTVFRGKTGTFVYDWSTMERWRVVGGFDGLDFDRLAKEGPADPGGAQNADPSTPLIEKDNGGRGSANAGDYAQPDPGFPAYLAAKPPSGAGADPLGLGEAGLAGRVDHIALDPTLDNISGTLLAAEQRDAHRIVAIQSPPGTGKTQFAQTLWASDVARRKLMVVPRVSLANAGSRRMGAGAVSYQAEGAEEALALVSTIHSLDRFDQFDEGLDLLVIDEFSAIIEQLCARAQNKLIADPVQTLRKLLMLMCKAKRCIIADADLTAMHIGLVLSALAKVQADASVAVYTHNHKNGQTLHTSSLDYARARMLSEVEACVKDPARRLVLNFDTKAETEVTGALLAAQHEGLKVRWISGDNSNEAKTHEELEDPDQMLEDYNIIAFNTAIDTGVSFNRRVDAVITFYGKNRDILPKSIMQMHMRVRNADYRLLGYHDWKPASQPDTPEEIYHLFRTRQHAEFEITRAKFANQFTMGLDGNYDMQCRWFGPTFFAVQAQEAAARNDRLAALGDLIHARFSEVVAVREGISAQQADDVLNFNDAKQLMAKTRENLHCIAVANAPRIAPEVAKKIDRKHVRSKEEKLSLERHKNETFYEAEVTPELVERDKRGKTKARLTRLARLRMCLEGHEEKLAFMEYERNQGRTMELRRTAYAETLLTAELFVAAFDLRSDENGNYSGFIEQIAQQSIEADVLRERLWSFIEHNREALGIFDTFGKLPTEQSMCVRWFHNLMRKLDIRTERKKRGSGSDGKVWRYTYLIEEPCTLGHACYLRLLARYRKTVVSKQWQEAVAGLTS